MASFDIMQKLDRDPEALVREVESVPLEDCPAALILPGLAFTPAPFLFPSFALQA